MKGNVAQINWSYDGRAGDETYAYMSYNLLCNTTTNTTTTTSSAIDLTYGGAIKRWMYLAKIDTGTLVRVRPLRG